MTVAPGSTPPLWSLTSPLIVAVACANAVAAQTNTTTATRAARRMAPRMAYVSLNRGNSRSALPRSIICSNFGSSFSPGS